MGKENDVIKYFEELFQAVNQASMLLLDTNLDTFGQRLLKAMGIVGKAVDVDRVYIWKNHLVNDVLYCTQLYEWSEGADPQQNNEYTIDIPYNENIPGWEQSFLRNECVNNLVRNMSAEEQAQLSPQGIISILVVPVYIKDEFWGFVGFDDCRNERTFTDIEEKMLRSTSLLFGHAYHQYEAGRLIREQEDKMNKCPLTGIYNRRFFDEKANHIMNSSVNGQLSLLMIDFDHFKEYNDNYGHQKGDECLNAVAQILSKSVGRAGDFVVRYGGDEFVIVLPLIDAEGACLIAEKIIGNMRTAYIPHEYSNVANHITLSIGVTSGIVEPSLTIDDFVKVADEMLYSSKEANRNRYTFGEMEKN
jgi:diguanylate cyclase (GGDEF)-like protein